MNVWTAARSARQQEKVRRLLGKAGEEEYQQLEAKREKDSREAEKAEDKEDKDKEEEDTTGHFKQEKILEDEWQKALAREAKKEKAPTEENSEENSGGKWTEVQRSRRSRRTRVSPKVGNLLIFIDKVGNQF